MSTTYDKMSLSHKRGEEGMNVNISRFIDTTLKERTIVYSPLIEAIVNSIEAISETKRTDGKIVITPIRIPKLRLKLVRYQMS